MTAIDRSAVLGHLDGLARRNFLKAQTSYKSLRGAFTRETPSDGAFEVYSDMGDSPWPTQNGGQPGSTAQDTTRHNGPMVGGLHSGGPITVLGGNERGMTVYNNTWQVTTAILIDAIEDNKSSSNLENWARSAGMNFEKHMDYLAFNALTAGTGTTYGNAYDNLTMFNASHKDPSAQYQTVQSNTNALPLSIDNYETVSVAGSSYLTDRGQPSGITPDLLIVSRSLARTGFNITAGQMAYDTANHEMNPYAGTKLLVAPGGYLGTTEWYAVASSDVAKPVNLQIRQAPKLKYWVDETHGNGIAYFKWTARYAVFYGDWRLATKGNA